jgi:hypothetical protein
MPTIVNPSAANHYFQTKQSTHPLPTTIPKQNRRAHPLPTTISKQNSQPIRCQPLSQNKIEGLIRCQPLFPNKTVNPSAANHYPKAK